MSAAEPLACRRVGATLHLTLQRPAARNALDAGLVAALTAALTHLPAGVRRLVLGGAGPAFCAGADLDWMVAGQPAAHLAALLAALDAAPVVVIGHAHGAAMGGGVGLLCCCDLVVVEAGCRLAFSEVRLGLVPALIAPYVVRKVGASAARRLFVTAETIGAQEACRLGIGHHLAADRAAAEAHIAGPWGTGLAACAPGAVAEAKVLLDEVATQPPALLPPRLAASLGRRLRDPEAREGVAAFRGRRPAAWAAPP